jgi:hypothetical protein
VCAGALLENETCLLITLTLPSTTLVLSTLDSLNPFWHWGLLHSTALGATMISHVSPVVDSASV